jgi:hypothetical protein
MVSKCFVYALIILVISSCCYTGKVTMYGLARKNVSLLKGGDVTYKYVDTTVLYKATFDFYPNIFNRNKYDYDLVNNNSYPYVAYYKFYGNGKLGLFIILKKDTMNLTRDDFNPLKAKMGYYSVTDKLIKTKIESVNDCTLHLINERGYISNDTLSLEHKNHYGHICLKEIVPDELLKNWSPDW